MAILRQDCGIICKLVSTTVSTSIESLLCERASSIQTDCGRDYGHSLGIAKKMEKREIKITITRTGTADLVNFLQLLELTKRNERKKAAKGDEEIPSRFVTL